MSNNNFDMNFIEYFKERPCNKCECYMRGCSSRRDCNNSETATILNRLENIIVDGCGDCFIEVKHYV